MIEKNENYRSPIDISEQDILAAMQEIQGYIDISPGDFQEIFQVAYRHAVQRLIDSRTAADIMTWPAHCVSLEMDLVQAATFLADNHITGAPVIDAEGKIVGIVSEKDFLARMGVGKTASFMQVIAHCFNNKGCIATLLHNHSIQEIMTRPAITAGTEMSIGAIAALCKEKQINRLPIVDTAGRPVGIVTRTDLVHAYSATAAGGTEL
jgi:CBS domain-containing membrane protein